MVFTTLQNLHAIQAEENPQSTTSYVIQIHYQYTQNHRVYTKYQITISYIHTYLYIPTYYNRTPPYTPNPPYLTTIQHMRPPPPNHLTNIPQQHRKTI